MDDLPRSMMMHPAIPTPSWRPRCELCALYLSKPDAYRWSTRQLLTGTITQQQIADELAARWDVQVDQPQLSRHRTRHLLPDLQAAHETYAAVQAVLSIQGDMDPVQLAQAVAAQAIMRVAAALEAAGSNPKSLAALARTAATLNRSIIAGEQASETLAKLKVERAMTEDGYRAGLVDFFREHYPHLVPALEGEAVTAADPTPSPSPQAERGASE